MIKIKPYGLKMVLAIIGDVRSSREAQNREKLQDELNQALEKVNSKSKYILSPYTITLGDEFQAVLGGADHFFRDFWLILHQVYPHKIRFAVGMGELTTPINPRQAIGMDGPAFHLARHAIQDLKKTPHLLKFAGDSFSLENLLNQSFFLISHLCSTWEKKRFKILLELMAGTNIQKISENLQVSNVAVYKNIRAGALEVILRLQEEAIHLINKYIEDQ